MNLDKYYNFNIEKIIQVFGYLRNKHDVKDKLMLIKLLFFADRIHIRRHFSLISNDVYCPLKHGPVGSSSLDVLNKDSDYLGSYSDDDISLLNKIEIIGDSRNIEESSTSYLSKNEMQILDEVVQIFGKFGPYDLSEISHDYPEWKRFQQYFEEGNYLRRDKAFIKMEDFFTNPIIEESPALQKYFGKDPLYEDLEYLDYAKSMYLGNE